MKEVVLKEYTSVAELAVLLEVPTVRIIKAAFEELGLLTTINEVLAFNQAKLLAAQFGYRARREGT